MIYDLLILDLRLGMRLKLIIFSTFLITGLALKAEKSDSTHISFSGQVTAWGIGQFQTPVPMQFGGRFAYNVRSNSVVVLVARIARC